MARWQFGFWFDEFNGAFNDILEAINDVQHKAIVIKGYPSLGIRGWLFMLLRGDFFGWLRLKGFTILWYVTSVINSIQEHFGRTFGIDAGSSILWLLRWDSIPVGL